MAVFLNDARTQIAAALEDSGLTSEESLAMVDTWTVSYFHTPGLRVLYVLPRAWTDALLPMSLDFVPSRVVRTLVGRIEVTTPAEEETIRLAAEKSFTAAESGSWFYLESLPEIAKLGRHAEAKVRAARLGVPEGPFGEFLDAAIDTMQGNP